MHIRNPRPSDFFSPIGLELLTDVQSTSVQNTNPPVDTRGAARLFPNVKEEDKTFSFFSVQYRIVERLFRRGPAAAGGCPRGGEERVL